MNWCSVFADKPTVYVTDAELAKQVFVTNCYKYLRPPFIRLAIPPLGNSLATSNGRDHAWQRKMINPAFSYANLKGMVPFMKKAAGDLLQVCRYKLRRIKGCVRTLHCFSMKLSESILYEGG